MHVCSQLHLSVLLHHFWVVAVAGILFSFSFAFESFNLMDLGDWVVVHGEYIIVRGVIIEWVWGFA